MENIYGTVQEIFLSYFLNNKMSRKLSKQETGHKYTLTVETIHDFNERFDRVEDAIKELKENSEGERYENRLLFVFIGIVILLVALNIMKNLRL